MGPKNSKPNEQNKQPTLTIDHPRFANVKFSKEGQNQSSMTIRQSLANEKQYQSWVKKLKTYNQDNQSFLFPKKHLFKKEGMCGSSGYAEIQYESFPFLLKDQIQNRRNLRQKFFDEPELWYLVYTLLTAGSRFHSTGQKIGDVSPKNVFINQDGQVKVATQYSWPSEFINYAKTQHQRETTYLAPQELKDLIFNKMQPSCDQQISESFSIGLTCLDAGTLGDSFPLYLKNSKFDFSTLENRLNELKLVGYSQLLTGVIRNLCEADPDNRCSCTQLFKWLEPYQEYITSLQNFQVNQLPPKLVINKQEGQSPDRGSYQNQSIQQVQQSPSNNIGQVQNGGYRWSSEQGTYIKPDETNIVVANPVVQYRQVTTNIPHQPINQSVLPPQQVHHNVIRMQSQPYPPTYQNPPPPQTIQQTYIVSDQQRQKTFHQQLQQQNGGPITSQTFTSSNYTPINYVNSQRQQGSGQKQVKSSTYTTQQYTYTNNNNPGQTSSPTKDENRSNMQLTLQKIDQQLQMSRKMFPS